MSELLVVPANQSTRLSFRPGGEWRGHEIDSGGRCVFPELWYERAIAPL